LALLSVVLATYRRPRLLRRALLSVLNQDYRDLIVLVCDNASGDETAEVVAQIGHRDPRVRYYVNSENLGLERNFAAGLERVTTPYFTFLSDDDLVLPNGYASLMAAFHSQPDAMISCGEALHVIAPNQLYNLFLRRWRPGVYEPPQGAFSILRNGLPFWSSMIFRKDLLDSIGGIDPATGALIDLDFELRAALRGKMLVSETPCTIFFSHEDAVSRVKHINFVWPGWLKLTENATRQGNLDHQQSVKLQDLLENRFVEELSFAALGCIRKGRYDEGLEAGRLLQEYGHRKFRGVAITALARASKVVPVLTSLMTLANKVRRWRSSQRIDGARYEVHLQQLIRQAVDGGA